MKSITLSEAISEAEKLDLEVHVLLSFKVREDPDIIIINDIK